MQYRLDNKSGNRLSVLGMGCMRLPGALGSVDLRKSEDIIIKAIEQGVNFFDTAFYYPGSEPALGHILEKNNIRDKVFIATKLPLFKCKSYEDFDKYFNIQLERLKTNYIDYYFMHNLSKQDDWERLCSLGIEKWILEKKAKQDIRNIGFSFHGVKDAFPVLIDSYDWDFCMIQYNYINTNYQAGTSGLKYAHSKDIPVFVMEPLLGGQLANKLPATVEKFFNESTLSATPVSLALRWLWNQPEVTLVLSGMNDISQLMENVTIAETAHTECMSETELLTVEKAAELFSSSFNIPCTGCNYCLPCPSKINIPDCFMAYNASYAISRFAGIQLYAPMIGMIKPAFSVVDCIRCGKCEKTCPQDIAIIERLIDVRKRMEPWWFRLGIAIVRKFMK